jgi:O-antigen ligase
MHTRSQANSNIPSARLSGRAFLEFIPGFSVFYVLVLLQFIGNDGGPRVFNILFWPVMAGVVIFLVLKNKSQLDKSFFLSLPILSLTAYLVFAGASIGWAFSPEYSLSRYFAQLFAIIVVLLPYALPISTERTTQHLHVYCAICLAINAVYVLTVPAPPLGHNGYFTDKQALGMFCGMAIIISLYELAFPGWRRVFAVLMLIVEIWIFIETKSKGSLAFLGVAIAFAGLTLLICRATRTTPAFIFGMVLIGFSIWALVSVDPIKRIGFALYGDPTITGRTYIWDFIDYQVSQRSWLGWGFHSYWFVPNSPQNQAPGWLRDMPSGHSGFLELKLDTGYIGYWIFLVFVFASVHGLEFARRRDPARAWLLLTLAIYIILLNFIESIWIQTDRLWLLYLIVVGETIHYSRSADPQLQLAKSLTTVRNRHGTRQLPTPSA